MASHLFLAAQEARRLIESYGLDGEEAQITAESETRLPDVIARLIEAEVADEAAIEACKARAQELRLRAERIQARIDRRRDEIAAALEAADLPRLDCGTATVSLTTTRPGVTITDPDALPPDCLRTKTTTTPDAKAIRAKLDAGEDVPGAALSNARRTVAVRRT
ncbi:MAG TPA: siphovirus Gp157 family protein [Geminicoccus sp.]|uniref:siphovirus Gp157 family protein n=1 Tax=Geminicoccus sp. TaxID=2024832 RepID=UPI002C7F25F4|nr:siphovirus Gp157 family protein [Geminicoccus sp.]HWL72119.1 siphovirus Gp157 family protein [Geminicoccus sp.]